MFQMVSFDHLTFESVPNCYDEYFSVKVHVGGSFRLSPILDYIGGNIVHIDQVEFDDFGIRDVDEFALRNGCSLGSNVVYVYSVKSSELAWLKSIETDYDIEEFKKIALKEKFMNIYIDSCPNNEFLRLYSNEMSLIKLSCEGSVHKFVVRPPMTKEIHGRKPRVLLQLSNVDFTHSGRWKYGRVVSDDECEDEEYEVTDIVENDTIFVREMNTFDDELDKEIKDENIELQRKEKKFVGTYARHSEEFKLRKATGYVETSSDSENDNVLSESESNSGIRSITDSSDEEEYDIQDRKNIRYVPFNEKSIKDIKFFPGLVFASYTYWCVKNINKTHNGCPEKKIHFSNNTFLTKALEGKFKVMPEMSLAATQVFIDDMFHIKVSKNYARNTKEKALKKVNRDHLEQFNLAHTYCQELMKAQPGSRYVDCTELERPIDPCVFRRLNNGYWSIAWAVMEKESYDSWKWFLEGMKEDLRITNQKEYGLEKVIGELLPNVAKRKESIVDATVAASNVDPSHATIAECEDDPRPALDQKIPATVAENEDDDDDIQIIKVVKDPNVDPTLSQREAIRAKSHVIKRAEEQNKKKKPS
ncbi:hypothetical protein LIER_38921 [Lithospermum erythrorhizon]|uniref:PB1-like domain-containing protein n=1 Tax=Lithospermum erythrorhizon TaxID=34254 RepID=A0AAV3Q8L4_LITER